ncbi:hypothetical protein F0562_017359 [Nyssa sinensis]|uniref:Uncharacterized protein n=1 Tax=Nyssa sinensis TaxID=561372 RepID=A0A5J4ZDZ2_9ASTE|nr:hypothetical protein F0562_017359 [Nyssa sinensis]
MSPAPCSDGFEVEPDVEGCNHGSFVAEEVFDAAKEALMVGWHWQSKKHEAVALGKRKIGETMGHSPLLGTLLTGRDEGRHEPTSYGGSLSRQRQSLGKDFKFELAMDKNAMETTKKFDSNPPKAKSSKINMYPFVTPVRGAIKRQIFAVFVTKLKLVF